MNSAERAGLRLKGNVPNLRFPEFSGEWHTTTIDGVTSEFQSGKFIKADLIQSKGSVPVYGGNGLRGYTDTYNHFGDYVLIGRQGALCGNVRFVTGETYITEHAIAVKGTEDNDTKYLQYQFERMNLGQYSDQSAQPGLAVNKLIKLKINIPQKQEQSKIARLLTSIDERITTQIRIIEELKLYRNALIFRLLTPKDKWLRLSIGDVAHVIGGGTPDTNIEDYWNGNIQWFTPSEIGKKKYVMESERTLTQKGLDNSSAKLLPPNTILLSTRATIGECSIARQECCTNQGFQSLIANKVTPEFLYYLIQTKKKDLLSKASGSTFAEISANEVRKIHICIPNTQEEQKAIVQPLSAYDEKIETECKILHLYELQKQYLLGQMFI